MTKNILEVERISHMRTRIIWKDENVSWYAEDALRKQKPFIFVPYIMKNNLHTHEAFLWIKDYINDENVNHIYDENRIIKKKKSPNIPKFKFGTQIPNNPHHAYKLDKVNNDKGWEDAMNSEVKSINKHQTFIILRGDELLPGWYQKIPYHYVFDAKLDNRKKGRLVTGGHKAPDVKKNDVYSSVVSIETIRVTFVLAAMNKL